MPTVEIKGYGTRVEFPDTMTDAEIEAALRDKVMPQLKAETAASDRQALEAMTPYERAQVLERHRNGGAQTVGEAMTQLSGAAPAVSPPAGALTSTPEGAAPGSRSFGQAVRDTGHNALVALGEPARGRLSLPGLQVALQGLATLPVPGANPAAGLMAYDRAAAAVLPEDVRPAPEGAGAWERALTETALPSLAAFADPANMGAMVAGGALAAPVAGALGLGEVLASPVASAAGKAAARAMQAGLGGAGALGAFGGVEAAQRGESPAGIALAAGKSAATGLELGATAGMPGGALGKLLGEVGIFGLAAPAMEGRMPTEDDVVGAIVMIGGLNAARGLSPGAIRGLLKRREDRTPEESQAVEAIPPEQMQAVVEELAQRDPGLATIHRAERIAREEPTRYQVQEAGGVPKATPLPRETPDQTKRLLAQVPDDVLLSELAREQQSDSRRRLLQEEFDRRTAAPEPEPQGEINQADILARQKKGRRLALAQSPTRSVTVGALKAGDRVKTVQGDGKVVKVTQNGVKVVTDAGATVSLFRGQRVRRYGEAGGAGAPEFSAPQERPAVEPRPLETALELQDYQEIVDLVPERAAREAVPRETPAEPAAPPVEPTPAPEVPAPDSGIAEVAARIIGARETPPAPWATTRATDGREMRVSLVTKAGDDVVYSTVGGRSLRTDGGSRYREILLIDEESDYSTTHWQEPGVLAHMRVSEFPDKSLLLIDEAQSDWASDARKGKAAKYPLSGTEWQRLLLTRAIQEAKASGLDHVGWVTGETTSARYNLEAAKEPVARGKYSRWVDNLGPDFPPDGGRVDFELFRGEGGGFSLDLYAKRGDGERVLVADESIPLNADALREYVGSAHAEKLAAEALEMAGEIGAERWAANLYDKSLPSVAKKLTGAEPSIIDIDGERVHAINLRDARKPLPALPQAAPEAPKTGKVPAPAAEAPARAKFTVPQGKEYGTDAQGVLMAHRGKYEGPQQGAMKADGSGLVWFSTGNYYGAGNVDVRTTYAQIPREKLLIMEETPEQRRQGIVADEAARAEVLRRQGSGRGAGTKRRIFEEAEKMGYLAVQREKDVSMRPETARKYLKTPPEGEGPSESAIAAAQAARDREDLAALERLLGGPLEAEETAPALPAAASEAPKPTQVPAAPAESPQGAAEKPTAESSQAGFLNLEAFSQLQPDRSVKRTKVKGARGVSEAVEGGLSPVSARLRRINPDLERRTRGLMHETGTAIIAARDTAKGLQQGLAKMAREDGDAYTALEAALGQGDSARIAEIVERSGLQGQYQAVREYLDTTRERMLDAGIKVGEVDVEYFPRRVRDYAGLMDHLGGEAAGEIGKQLKARADKLGVPVDALPPEIRDQIVNSYLRGRIPPGEGKPGMTKPRTIDNFTEDLLPFYYRPEEALAKYISTAEEAIARARFFGKGEDVTGSIGSYVADLIARGEIKPSQEREVKNALLSLFNRNPSWQFIRDTKNVTYAMTMGSTASAVTQVGDLAWSLYENGAYQTAKQAGKSILRKQGLSKRDIGIQDIASEFDSLGKSGKALDTLFKLTGLEQMDALGKETLINGSLARARKQAKRIAAGKKDYAARRFQRDLDRYFGSEQEQILKDLASGETTEPVKFFLFNKLLDYQPVARSEMPQFYLEHPNMRIGYQLKSFTLKQMDAFRRESFDLIRDGARKGDRQMQIDGMRNLVRLGSFFVLANASADVIKDVMFGRGLPKADDLMWDNVLRLFGFSRYLTWRVRREGLGTAAAQFVGGPIVGKLDDAWKDGVRIHRGLTKSEYEVEWDKLRLLNSFPLAGAWYFWYKGQGADWIKEDAVKEAKENAPGVRQSRSSRPTRPTRQGR